LGRRVDTLYEEAERLFITLGDIAKELERINAALESEALAEAAALAAAPAESLAEKNNKGGNGG